MLVVVGGTLAVTIMSYSIAGVTRAQQAMLKALVHRPTDPAGAAETALNLAEVARDRGPMYLQNRIGELKRVPFLQRAMSLVIDGAPPEEIEPTLSSEITATAARHARASGGLRPASPELGRASGRERA